MANFSINGVGFPSPLSAVKSSSPPVHYQPLSSSFSPVSQFPSPYFVHSQRKGGGPTVSSQAGSLCISSHTDVTMSQSPLESFSSPPIDEGLGSSLPASPNLSTRWQHSIPTSMPWANERAPGARTRDLTQFTASTVAAINSSESRFSTSKFSPTRLMRAARRQKRKSNGYSIDCPPDKVLINEERMAEKMQGLQLQGSNQCNVGGRKQDEEEEQWFSTVQDDSMVAEDEETGERICVTRGQRSRSTELQLHLSEELERGFNQKDSLARLVQEQLNKSQMQVVLWQPPGGQISDLVSKVTQGQSETQDIREEGRCEGDGMASVVMGRGEADGISSSEPVICGLHSKTTEDHSNYVQPFSCDFSKPSTNSVPVDPGMKPGDLNPNSSSHSVSSLSSIAREQLNSSYSLPQQCKKPTNHVFSSMQQSQPMDNAAFSQKSSTRVFGTLQQGQQSNDSAFNFSLQSSSLAAPQEGGQAFSFTNLLDSYVGQNLGMSQFNRADLTACSTPREYVGSGAGVVMGLGSNSAEVQYDICDRLDDNMDL